VYSSIATYTLILLFMFVTRESSIILTYCSQWDILHSVPIVLSASPFPMVLCIGSSWIVKEVKIMKVVVTVWYINLLNRLSNEIEMCIC
jgi:hypothetical protein